MNGGIGCQLVGLGSGCRPEFKPFPHSVSLNKKLHSTVFVSTPHPPVGLSLRFLSLSGEVACESFILQILLYLVLFDPFSN